MYNKILCNFISPVTGRILANPNYILVGDRKGITISSPILTDIRLDIINLKKGNNIVNTASFVLGTPSPELPNAQILSNLSNGLLYNIAGTLSTYNIIPIDSLTGLLPSMTFIGDYRNRPIMAPPPRGPEGKRGERGDMGEGGIGVIGLAGLLGLTGLAGLAGLAGHTGPEGAAGDKGASTLDITTNYDMNGGDIGNGAQSPEGDFSALTAKWLWDVFNDNVIFKF